MPRIVVSTEIVSSNASLAVDLHRLLGGSVVDIRSALSTGTPLFDGDLFQRPPEETAKKVMDLVSLLTKHGIMPQILEGSRPVTEQFLQRLIDSRNSSIDEFDDLRAQGHNE